MGSKITYLNNKTILNLLIITTCLISASTPTFSAAIFNIPQTTLQIARESENQYINSPKSKTVRVGIGTKGFNSYIWNEATLYGTGEFEVYNKDTYINTYDNFNKINVKMVGKIFVLTDSDNKVIAKVSGPIRFKTDFGFLGVEGLTRAGKDALYRGEIELVSATKPDTFHIVNVIEVEEYLRGVVPNEMPIRFGLEALKAQSVAARNYVLSPRVKSNPNYDVVDSVASQVYFGVNTETPISNQAVNETTGIVAIYNWDLILAQYSSTAGGYSESFKYAFSDPKTKKFPSEEKPYLIAKPDYPEIKPLNKEEDASEFYKSRPKSFDEESPYFRWEREWNGQEIQDAIQSNIASQSTTGFITPSVEKDEIIGYVKKLDVKRRGDSGKIIELEIQTEDKNYTVQKELVIRRLLTNKGKALPSANVVFEHEYNENGELIYIKAYGGGYGHGVGLSQYGAGHMGKDLNLTFDEILKHYYSGISLATEPIILSADKSQNNITQNFWSQNGKAILVVDNKYKVKYIDACINNVDEKIEFNENERYNQIDLSKYLVKGMNTINFKYPNEQEKNKGLRMYIELVGENGNNN